ncbi:MAG: ParB/RepB/Spo0J family partition protein [Candidatus Bathyarchaeia archaeon]|nr:ParB/RepB/Spo0J family partition protein [Candidatus Bathyarchaeia archaeon]
MKISKTILEVPVDTLKPDRQQPRKTFPEEEVAGIAQTIKAQGTINAIEVDENDVIITGEIRWRGAKKAGVKTVPIRRILNITPEERLERQLIENLHHTPLNSVERENAIYKLWKTGRYKTHRELAQVLGYKEETIRDYIEAKEFRDETAFGAKVSTRVITSTRGLPKEEREQVLKKVEKGAVRPEQVREVVKTIKQAPEPIKEKFFKGEIPAGKAKKVVEIYKKAPKPLKQAIIKEEVKPERAEAAVKLYEELERSGTELDETRVAQHVEQLKKETRMEEAQAKIQRETSKEVLSGKKEAFDTMIMERGRIFVREVKDVAWKVKGWGIPTMMRVGAESWIEAQKYFKQIRDHMDLLLRSSPTEKGD